MSVPNVLKRNAVPLEAGHFYLIAFISKSLFYFTLNKIKEKLEDTLQR